MKWTFASLPRHSRPCLVNNNIKQPTSPKKSHSESIRTALHHETQTSPVAVAPHLHVAAVRAIFERRGFAVAEAVGGDADGDLARMVFAATFVPSGGGFSALIAGPRSPGFSYFFSEMLSATRNAPQQWRR